MKKMASVFSVLESRSVLWIFITSVLSCSVGFRVTVFTIIFTCSELSGPALSMFGLAVGRSLYSGL